MKTLAQLEQEAQTILLSVKDIPQKRLELRQDFYRKYGYGKLTEYGYGNSELAFLEWEIKRGVLNSPQDPQQAGSPWWRGVNGDFIYLSTLAALIYESGQSFEGLPFPVIAWLDYIQNPSSQTWYKAHNSSICTGYVNRKTEALQENDFERIFMNMVLYRVLFAEAMVEGKAFGDLGEILADSRLPSVDIIVNIPAFYPDHYPLSKEDILDILHEGHSIADLGVDILDKWIILPHLAELYSFSADLLHIPMINQWCTKNVPTYPVPFPAMSKYFSWGRFIHFIKALFSFFKKKK